MFMHADGGYERVVWMPAETKERLQQFIPASVYTAIATEKDVNDITELRAFLAAHHHPAVKRWVSDAPPHVSDERHGHVFSAGDIPLTAGGFRIILKNAKITAEKVIIVPVKPSLPGGGEHHAAKK
jgi:acetyl-CoA decarbonylase/synthase complex subunit beta